MPRPRLERPTYRLRLSGARWYIFFTEDGRTRSVSTGQTVKREAEKWRDQWIAGRNQPIPPPQATIAEIMQAYTAARLPHVESKQTMRSIAGTIARLIGNLQPRMLSRSTYVDTRARNAVGSGTIRREVSVLRAALTYAVREGWITETPYVEMPMRPPPRDRWLTREEVQALIDCSRSQHIRLFIVLAYHTAARTGAILDLTWSRVDLDRKLIRYARPGRGETKKRRATVPVNSAALAELQSAFLLRTTDYVIEYNGSKVASIEDGFRRACQRAGIADCTPHVLRHTAASHLIEAGIPVGEVARYLGDSVAMVEQVYGKHSPDYLRRAADALAGVNVGVRQKRNLRLVKN